MNDYRYKFERSRTAYNRAYLAMCLRHYAQIQQSWTSDTLGTLAAIVSKRIKRQKIIKIGGEKHDGKA